ncbi:hypothetical protein DRJ17_05745 [Candidatus Woesearchaeota archaeon]|nr:MAG: hypothetical protein DRJ17_05745 [Candidatus Woesearchaeota archaeon]
MNQIPSAVVRYMMAVRVHLDDACKLTRELNKEKPVLNKEEKRMIQSEIGKAMKYKRQLESELKNLKKWIY